MFKNYCRLTWRNLLVNKGYTLINIVGLAMGLSVCLFILLFIFHETSYDKQHAGSDRLYRVATAFKSQKDVSAIVSSNANVGAGLKAEMPEVEQAARLLEPGNDGSLVLGYEDGGEKKVFYEKKGYYVDASYFDLFAYRWLRGDARTAMAVPNTAVVSRELALKLFGRADPVGKTLKAGNGVFTVKGVFEPLGPSHIDGDLFLNMDNEDLRPWLKERTNWATYNTFMTYIRLKKGTDVDAFSKKLNPFLHRHGSRDITNAGAERMIFLQPVADIHLHTESPYDHDLSPNLNRSYLYILGCIAFFVLLIACVNFMNLSTARSQRRAKEVGVRKVMGALRGQLVAQFLGESLFISFVSLLVALLAVWLLLPAFNLLAQRELSLFDYPAALGWIAGLGLVAGLLAGVYPAFYLSSFRPIKVLKGQLVNSLSVLFLRKGLVIFQFTIAIFLILSSLLIWEQLRFWGRTTSGFRRTSSWSFRYGRPGRWRITGFSRKRWERIRGSMRWRGDDLSGTAAFQRPAILPAGAECDRRDEYPVRSGGV
ncbi:ABC transporter permease [Puia sp. P3]|uniref:ABC transporter permease n=1 Tax=Puia sp. P3 TaxID=3423952 RepID=UPI003D665281